MILLVIWLFVETKRAVIRERRARQDGKVTHNLRRERCTYAIISVVFGLSYIGRFFFNEYDSCDEIVGTIFESKMTGFVVQIFEGTSMGVLMLFHCINFKNGSLFTTLETEEQSFALILPGEYFFFPDEEVDAVNLADRSIGCEESVDLEGESSVNYDLCNDDKMPNHFRLGMNASTMSHDALSESPC